MKPYTSTVVRGAILQVLIYAVLLLFKREPAIAAAIALLLAAYYVVSACDYYRVSLGAAMVSIILAPIMLFAFVSPWNFVVFAVVALYAIHTFMVIARELNRKVVTAIAVVIIAVSLQGLAIQTTNDLLLRPWATLTGEELLRAALEWAILFPSCALLYIFWLLVENHQRVKPKQTSAVVSGE